MSDEPEMQNLRAEVDALRVDATRYRWLRLGDKAELYIWAHGFDPCTEISGERLDVGIDAAIRADAQGRQA